MEESRKGVRKEDFIAGSEKTDIDQFFSSFLLFLLFFFPFPPPPSLSFFHGGVLQLISKRQRARFALLR